ncbi:MAG TPA: gluconate 2-dehydrogenase subunit 3 family protein [Thermoanaerobaculia bacterium]|nr:gluconate 2-dehydrogenase subunit 3 family protein [Thermoanaerobaculia bacterium]
MIELSDLQRRTLAAAAERILPSDDGPGAAETGVAETVAAALGEERLWGWFPLFSRGLDRLEAMAREAYGIGFAEASPEQRDEVLRRLQEIPEPPLRHFFAQLIRLCVEGFVGQNGPGWRYVGYPPEEMEGDGCLGPTPA